MPSIVAVLETLTDAEIWVHEKRVYHKGSAELREAIGEAIDRVRPTGVRGTALLFGAVLLVAMGQGTFTPADIAKLDTLGQGNADYILGRLDELEGEANG
ncbi:hypothetical protein AB0D91_48250 [Streptomyces canus]|uniref:hypothetical protein n=1 Tax=Streptomyces canus TaxID=58343 RepID=UPI0033CA7245